MIQNVSELEVCKRRLLKLQAWAERIENHPNKSEFAKELELAGVCGMIEQIQEEIEDFESSRFYSSQKDSPQTQLEMVKG